MSDAVSAEAAGRDAAGGETVDDEAVGSGAETGADRDDVDGLDDGGIDPADEPGAPRRRSAAWPLVLCLVLVGALLAGGGYLAGHRSAAAGPSTTSADAGFARDMAIHHQQAIDMAFTIRDATDDPNVRLLAFDIINTQANQRGMMLGWLQQWNLPVYSAAGPMAWMGAVHTMTPGGPLMPGMATDAQMAQLGAAHGKDAEILFLKLMIAHHKGGVEMAQAYLGLGQSPQEKRLAQTIIDSQLGEIRMMSDMLTARGVTS